MKHAYLILAHNEFEMLQRLLDQLDHPSNDVFVHIDAKVARLPELSMRQGRLSLLPNRIETYWGDISLVKAEFLLMDAALASGPYEYYHIISGTHFPLLGVEAIRARFDSFNGKSVLQRAESFPGEIRMKLGKYHYFIKNQNRWKNIAWRALLRIQDLLPGRNTAHLAGKASQWCSLCHQDVSALVKNEPALLHLFRRTFCCDEFFMPAALTSLGIQFVWDDHLLFLSFNKASPVFLKDDDLDRILHSGCIFARKFNKDSFQLIDRICQDMHT